MIFLPACPVPRCVKDADPGLLQSGLTPAHLARVFLKHSSLSVVFLCRLFKHSLLFICVHVCACLNVGGGVCVHVGAFVSDLPGLAVH